MIKIGDYMKIIKVFAMLFFIFICLYFAGIILFPIKTNEYIQKEIGLDISSCNILKDEDTHGGFLGDGTYFLIANCSNNKENILSQISHWKNFPLTQKLEWVVYGYEKDGVEIAKHIPESIPRIENGYYYFYDRQDDVKDPFNEEKFFDRASYNYTLVLYDKDTNLFYYFELDT